MIRDALVWCLVAATAIAVAAALVLRRRNKAITAKKQQAEAALTLRVSEADSQLATLRAELRQHQAEHAKTIQEAEEAAEESTKAVLKGSARFLQSLAAEQLALLEDIQRKYGGHSVLGDLLEVSHANAQMARKAQGIAVMCGAPLGRRNKPASVYDVVRSAQSQIRNFRRVEIMQQTGFALKASAVSPVALAVAELLDNAASFSQQGSPIEVTFQRVQKNLCIVIDDAGVGMNDEERTRADKLLASDRVSGVSALGNPPQFGFAVIGVLSERFGFEVSVDSTSPYGGVRAVLLLPHDLLTNAPEQKEPAPAVAPTVTATGFSGPEGALTANTTTADGLPKRRRKRPMAIVPGSASAATPARSGAETAAIMGAFQRGTQSGRATPADPADKSSSTRGASSEGHEVS